MEDDSPSTIASNRHPQADTTGANPLAWLPEQPTDPAPSECGPIDTPKARLVGLIDYIERVEGLLRKPAFVVPAEFYCAYEEELAGLPGIECNLTAEGDELWLRVAYLQEKAPPALPEELADWVAVSSRPDQPPVLRDAIASPPRLESGGERAVKRSDIAGLDRAFENYRTDWSVWAEEERPRRLAITAYQQLQYIHRLIESEGSETPLELVWGVGIALWKHPSGQNVVHPIVTIPVELRLDHRTLAFEIRPRNAAPGLATEPFDALEVGGIAELEETWRTQQARADGGILPFQPSTFEPILRAALEQFDKAGRYWPDVSADRALPDRTPQLIVTDTWVIYARRRSPNFLIDDLQRLRASIEAANEVPRGVAMLVSAPDDVVRDKQPVYFRGLSYTGPAAHAGESVTQETAQRELYFPKPYNDEQVSIVQKLESADGVVVQGPPGTGKTHTIANIICHYLANGRRVLVTSKGAPALAALHDHIPGGVRALAVSLLTDEKDGMRQFEQSVQTIATTIAQLDPIEHEREIAAVSARIDDLHARLASVDQEISRWARLHLRRVSFQGREMLPDELARHAFDRRGEFEWLTDRLSAQGADPKFSDADIASARKARFILGADIAYVGIELPPLDRLPSSAAMGALHDDVLHSRQIAARMREERTAPLADAKPETIKRANELLAAAEQFIALYQEIFAEGEPGAQAAYTTYRNANADAMKHLDDLLSSIARVDIARRVFVERPVEIPDDAEVDAEFVDAVARGAIGKNPLGMFNFGKGHLRLKLESVRTGGLQARTTADWQHAHAWVHCLKDARSVVAQWNATAREIGLTLIDPAPHEMLRRLAHEGEQLAKVKEIATEREPRLEALMQQVFGAHVRLSAMGEARQAIERVAASVSSHLERHRLAGAIAQLNELLDLSIGRGGAISTSMRAFLANELGKDNLTASQASERWGNLRAELRRLVGLRPALLRVERVASLVAESGAMQWAEKMRTVPALDAHDPWTPPNWREAWQWRQIVTLLETIDGREPLARLQKNRGEIEDDLARTYQRLVEKKAWLQISRSSSDAVKSALQAYLNAVLHIGRGTGIRANRYRNEARRAMQEAYRAVPCWIMPHWRVSETLPADIGKFDLVIVDEASQSNLWALPSLLRGAKILIVGDEKQVAPEGVGFGEERIADLKSRFLAGQVYADQMTPEKSLYDLARVAFAGNMVMLREHFRCVAPIIEFSRREFYGDALRPLRVPRVSERLDPPLIDVLVRGATRRGAVNDAEARAIVEEIQSILADPRCAGRTIGVVSLAGIEQAHCVFDLIRAWIPPQEIVARQITVGDARTFQGKERDIMLLSMVATPEQRITSAGPLFEQRFNVAASRARDRMVLFRSVELADLSTLDLKARLIEHFATPYRDAPPPVSDLRDLCQTTFERELFDALSEIGYRVWPQVHAGVHAIDLVVEGDDDRRLAIECDGDRHQALDSWALDMARQRVLERAGWTFWRSFASSFTLHRDATMSDLVALLNAMKIRPIGAVHMARTGYTEHREVTAVAPVTQAAPLRAPQLRAVLR
jgi:very-short-patch-repair endonuclease